MFSRMGLLLSGVGLVTIGLSQSGCGLLGRTVGTAVRTTAAVASTAVNVAGGAAGMGVQLLPVKSMFSCIPEGTPIDTPEGPRPIEDIRPGDSVTGFGGDAVCVEQVHAYRENPEGQRFLRIQFENGAVVRLCDRHRIDGIPAGELATGGRVGERRVASIEKFGGVARSYDLLTGDAGYRISGLPVNSMIEEMLAAAAGG